MELYRYLRISSSVPIFVSRDSSLKFNVDSKWHDGEQCVCMQGACLSNCQCVYVSACRPVCIEDAYYVTPFVTRRAVNECDSAVRSAS